MSLSCSCSDYDWDTDSWIYYQPNDFTILNTKRGRRCCSCKALIKIGQICVEFERYRYAQDAIEAKIHGEGNEIPISSYWMCERCGEIYLNLSEIGYCIDITEKMEELLSEYQEISGFKKEY